MRRGFHRRAASAVWLGITLGLTIFVALLVSQPMTSNAGADARGRVFSVVGGDYISPLISSPRGIRSLNARLMDYAQFAGYDQIQAFVSWEAAPELANVTRYCGNLFSVIGAEFVQREHEFSGGRPAYISEAFWQRAFNRSDDVIGKIISVGGEWYCLAGIIRTTDTVLNDTEVWVPVCSRGPYGTMTSLRVIGELRVGANWTASERNLTRMVRTDIIKEEIVEIDRAHMLPVDRKVVFHASAAHRAWRV